MFDLGDEHGVRFGLKAFLDFCLNRGSRTIDEGASVRALMPLEPRELVGRPGRKRCDSVALLIAQNVDAQVRRLKQCRVRRRRFLHAHKHERRFQRNRHVGVDREASWPVIWVLDRDYGDAGNKLSVESFERLDAQRPRKVVDYNVGQVALKG